MPKSSRSAEEIESDVQSVETYLNHIVENNRVSGLYWEIRRDYEAYKDNKKDRLLRALAKEVRMMVRETFSKSELESYRSLLGMLGSDSDAELNAVMKRGEILNNDEFQSVGVSIDRALSEGDALDIDAMNPMLLAYEKKKSK